MMVYFLKDKRVGSSPRTAVTSNDLLRRYAPQQALSQTNGSFAIKHFINDMVRLAPTLLCGAR